MSNRKQLMTVAIASPIPKQEKGGIATWTRAVIEEISGNGDFNCHHLNYAAQGRRGSDTTFLRRFTSGVKATRNVIREFRQIRPKCDVLHICSSASLGLARDIRLLRLARKNNLPTIIHWHFSRIPELQRKNNWEWKLLLIACRLADSIIVLDELSLKALEQTGIANSVIKIPNPIAQDTMIHRNDEVKVVPNTILFVGNVMPYKAVDVLVKACSNMRDNIRLKIVGDFAEGYHQELMRIASKRPGDWIKFTGGITHEQVLIEMHKCSVFTLPSRHTEAFPFVLIEAMTLGKPTVVTAVGAMPEMVAKNGEPACGIVVPPEDVSALQAALERLLADDKLRNDLGEQAQLRALTNYSMDAVVGKLYDLWRSTTLNN